MAAKLQRRRALIALGTVLATFIALAVPFVNYALAQGDPNIVILNPSGYSDDGAEQTPLIVSDAETGDDEEDGPNEDTYRLNAWVANAPDEALVEFELQTGLATETLGTAERVADDTLEFNWDVTQSDGAHTIRAILYEGSGTFAEEIDRHERPILIRGGNPRPETEAPTVDIIYPTNGGPGGFYINPLTGDTNILIDYEYSTNVDTLFFFYTLSDPGDDPIWKDCGSEFIGNADPTDARFRCDLESVDQGGLSVTGVAIVANDDESGEGDPAFNTSGDAVRLLPYDQDAISITVDRETTRVDSNAQGVFGCSPTQSVTVVDQLDRAIGGINVDAHAQGPSDQTKFYSGSIPLIGTSPSISRTPDKAHGTELSRFCPQPGSSAQVARLQGDHNRVGVPDVKHMEDQGTGDTGTAGLSLWADRSGSTQITIWADEDNDDQYCSQELAVPASIGWDEPGPLPVLQPAELDVCPIPTPPPPGGTPTDTGSPTESPTEDPRGCTVIGTEGDDELRGTSGDDIICGLGGDDTIRGLGGNDTIHGDEGDDIIRGGPGDDTIDGGGGRDGIFGGGGEDVLDGGDDNDVVLGGRGDDTIRGNAGADLLEGEKGRDIVTGGSGNDRILGGAADDIVKGGIGNDRLFGNAGPDILRGGRGNDTLNGGGGPDTMRGGPGRDKCIGGGGRDRQSGCESGK